MKKNYVILFILFLVANNFISAQVATLTSGEVSLNVRKIGDTEAYGIYLLSNGREINTGAQDKPITLKIYTRDYYYNYTSYELTEDTLKLTADITYRTGAKFLFKDEYTSDGNNGFYFTRKVSISDVGTVPEHDAFSSSLNFKLKPLSKITDNEYFVPAVWYRTNFYPEGNIPLGIPTSSDVSFLYRDDRTPLPVLMMREIDSGLTLTMILTNSPSSTTLNDAAGVKTDLNYEFGGVGITQVQTAGSESTTAHITYPGLDIRAGGKGERSHPILVDFDKHNYSGYIKVDVTSNYARALKNAWEKAFDLYQPKVYTKNLKRAYNGLINTINGLYLQPGINNITAPGFPWGVDLNTFNLNLPTMELGFVGSQPGTGYALYRAGIENQTSSYRTKGESVLDFWADKSLSPLGLPHAYCNAYTGKFTVAYTNMRQSANGMNYILMAWAYAKKNGIDKPNWLKACEKYGEFLLTHQNADGSYWFGYHPDFIVGNLHPKDPINTKYLTICVLRYLVELYIATDDVRFKNAALKAGAFCYSNIHLMYNYIACVTDNPQTIDSESGQQAINGFLALYDLTKDKKWLEAAEQAATYTETWTFMHEVPVEIDQTINTNFPRDRSIVGQHVIAIGHSASDLGFAWSSFVYYRLYLLTGNQHYLHVARISAHNTKESMNMYQSLYPGQYEALQLEAFQVGIPRRGGIMESLNWNYAAHLDPMIRFKDAFGTYDIEDVELMETSLRDSLNYRYSFYQSADYGQVIDIPSSSKTIKATPDKINISYLDNSLVISFKETPTLDFNIEILNLNGQIVFNTSFEVGENSYTIPFDTNLNGVYFIRIKDNLHTIIKKFLVQ